MVLIVEDDAVSRRALQQLLRVNGFDATAVASAEEAERLIDRGSSPDVALVDVALPGKNGLEFIGWLESHAPSVWPMLLTSEDRQSLSKFRHEHRCAYFQKPIDFQTLLRLLKTLPIVPVA